MSKKRSLPLLLLCILSLIVLLGIFFFLGPGTSVSVLGLSIRIVILFLPVLFVFFYSLTSFLLQRKIHGILLASFATLYIVLRISGFTHILFFLILVALLLILELLFSKRS